MFTSQQFLRVYARIAKKFVKNFSTIARPLHKLTEAKQKFIWSDECNNAFYKFSLTSAPVLAHPEKGKQLILDTKSKEIMLSQEIDDQGCIIAYFSKRLSRQGRNCVARKELLAVLKAVEYFHPYLYDGQSLLRTNQTSLT
ncbi:retrovirus-related Pol polyprotein from transposon 412 [Trichonephila clavipes]|nr:retrovirus-related Pol polyprotein from transposon 412 [Trichonephila clavipes]